MLAVALVLTLSAAGFMQDRFAAIEPQVQRYLQGDVDSEVGQRLALWQAARTGRAARSRSPASASAGFER